MNNIKTKIGLKIWQLVFICVFFSSYAFPFSSLSQDNELPFDVEVVNLASETPSLSRLDIYVKLIYDAVQFIKKENKEFWAEYEVSINVTDTESQEIKTHTFKDTLKLDSMDEVDSTDKYDLNKISFNLSPGTYDVAIEVKDIETGSHGLIKSPIELAKFSDTELQASNILFIDEVNKNENGKYVFQPRVSSLQNDEAKILAYFEVYNVSKDDSFQVDYRVLNPVDSIFYEFKYNSVSKGRVSENFIDVSGEILPHGSYKLRINVATSDSTITLEKDFDWYLSGFPASFSSIDDAIVVLKYLIPKKEYKRLLKLKDEEKHKEFLKFWKKRDPTPLTAENELRTEYYSRIAFANANYHTISRDGWQTDRGWVYVLLGPPDDIQRNPYANNFWTRRLGKTVKAIEVWEYYQYNRQLIFYDHNGFGQYQLENPETLYEIIRK